MDVSSAEALFANPAIVLLSALILDLLLGGPRLVGRIPGPDALFEGLAAWFSRKLNRADRSAVTRFVRGGLCMTVLCVLAFLAGLWIEGLATPVATGVISLVAVALIIGQRYAVSSARRVQSLLREGRAHDQEEGYEAARWAVERLAIRSADGLIANSFWFLLAGLPGLFAYRVLAAFAVCASPRGVVRSDDAFFDLPERVYAVVSLIPGLILLLLSLPARLVMPRAKHSVARFSAFRVSLPRAQPVRLWGVGVYASALGIALRTGASKKIEDGELNEEDSPKQWLGISGSRARVDPADIARAILLNLIFWLLGFALIALLALMSERGQIDLGLVSLTWIRDLFR